MRWGWGALIALGFFSFEAAAHDSQHANLDSWYQSLQRPQGTYPQGYYGGSGNGSCCNKTDCHPTEAELRSDGFWWARLGSDFGQGLENNWKLLAWVRVPPDRVLKHDNQDGRPIICHSLVYDEHHEVHPETTEIYCFIPEAQG